MLLTYSGATLATTLITQFLKSVRWLDRVPTRVLSYVIALAIMIFAELARGGATWQELLLTSVNAVVVALAANGAFDSVNHGRTERQLCPPSHCEYGEQGADEDEPCA